MKKAIIHLLIVTAIMVASQPDDGPVENQPGAEPQEITGVN